MDRHAFKLMYHFSSNDCCIWLRERSLTSPVVLSTSSLIDSDVIKGYITRPVFGTGTCTPLKYHLNIDHSL